MGGMLGLMGWRVWVMLPRINARFVAGDKLASRGIHYSMGAAGGDVGLTIKDGGRVKVPPLPPQQSFPGDTIPAPPVVTIRDNDF